MPCLMRLFYNYWLPSRLRFTPSVILYLLAAWIGSVAPSTAAEAAGAHPRVAGFDRFYSGEKGDAAAGGQLLLGELNCTSCHQADPALAGYVERKPAPVLDTVGSRVRMNYLKKFLFDPQATKPGTTMPSVLTSLPEAERREKVEAIVQFLATTGTTAEGAVLRQQVNRGELLFHSVGCLACHDPRKADSPKDPLPSSIVLGAPSRKYTPAGLAQFLTNPLAVRPGGRMPHLNLEPGEAQDVAAFLLRDLEVSSGLQFSLYEGSWDRLPDFTKLTPKEAGDAGVISVDVTKRKDHFALRFDGQIILPKDADYEFIIGSDDGSRLLIDGKVVVEYDGVHPYGEQQKKINLKAGPHQFAVEYFEASGEEQLTVQIQADGLPRQPLDALLAPPPPKKTDKPAAEEPFVDKPELVAKGRDYFTTLGCASCHELKWKGQLVAAKYTAPPLAGLKAGNGCLAAAPGKAPFYGLNQRQRDALSAALAIKAPPALAAPELVSRTLVRFNCVACHQRGDLGGIEDARNPHFQSDMPEMGDEGRLPPHLTGAGAKLRKEWLQDVLQNGSKERPYMFTRMPRFGAPNVGHLVAAVEQADAGLVKPAPKIDVDENDKKFKAAGRRLTGAQGFSCIKCHTFAGYKSTGIQALSLTRMTKRLRRDWFHYYMLSPLSYRPGTRMPTAFPEGNTTLPTLLDGSVPKQIGSIWSYLNEGDAASLPSGLVSGKMEIVATDEAVIYRNFISDAGPRAIGVGYPEKLNLAFDANQMRLALLWHGGFIDASRHWSGRGEGFQPPLGDNILKFSDAPSFALLNSPNEKWPNQKAKENGYHFGGYRLGEGRRPTFLYRFHDLQIEDLFAPVGEADVYVFRRTLTLTGKPVSPLYFRAAAAGKIEKQPDGVFLIDGKWKMKLSATDAAESVPLIRQIDGQTELLLPIKMGDQKVQIVQDFDW